MPYTVILLITRQPGITSAKFKHHFEGTHIPLLKSVVGEDFPLSHTRHYLDGGFMKKEDPKGILFNSEFLFDAFAVLTFADKAHWSRFVEKCKDERAGQALKEDDDKWQDSARLKAIFVGDTKSTGRDGGEMGWRFVAGI